MATMKIKTGQISLIPFLDFAANNPDLLTGTSPVRVKEAFKELREKALAHVPKNSPGWFIWGTSNSKGGWDSALYLGRSGKKKDMYDCLNAALWDDRLTFWSAVLGRDAALRQGDKKYPRAKTSHRNCALKRDARMLVWVTVDGGITDEELNRQEDVLVDHYDPPANTTRRKKPGKPNAALTEKVKDAIAAATRVRNAEIQSRTKPDIEIEHASGTAKAKPLKSTVHRAVKATTTKPKATKTVTKPKATKTTVTKPKAKTIVKTTVVKTTATKPKATKTVTKPKVTKTVTKPKATKTVTKPKATVVKTVTKPKAVKTTVTKPKATKVTKPKVVKATVVKTVSKPKATKTTVTKPKATKTVTKPKATKTTVTKPKATKTTVTKPKATKTTVTKPKAVKTTVVKTTTVKSKAVKPPVERPAPEPIKVQAPPEQHRPEWLERSRVAAPPVKMPQPAKTQAAPPQPVKPAFKPPTPQPVRTQAAPPQPQRPPVKPPIPEPAKTQVPPPQPQRPPVQSPGAQPAMPPRPHEEHARDEKGPLERPKAPLR